MIAIRARVAKTSVINIMLLATVLLWNNPKNLSILDSHIGSGSPLRNSLIVNIPVIITKKITK